MASASQQTSFDDLQHNILLNEALLASLEGDNTAESQRDRITIQEKLRDLNTQLKSHSSIPNWGATANMDSRSSRWTDIRPSSSNSEDLALTPNSTGSMPPPDLLALPSCKRQRNTEDQDNDNDFPDAKSLRPSPALSAAPSPASTTNSFDFNFDDDPVMQSIFGPKVKQEAQEEKKYFTELEKKRKQEKEDEAFARKLAESENVPQFTAIPVQWPGNYNQTIFSQDGSSFRKMPPPTPSAPIVKPERLPYPSNTGLSSQFSPSSNGAYSPYAPPPSYKPPLPSAWAVPQNGSLVPPENRAPLLSMGRATPRAISLTDSDSDIEEINANDFTPSTRQRQQRPAYNGFGFQPAGQSKNLPFAPTIPGKFPGGGFAGASVYGDNTSTDLFSTIDREMAELGYNTGSATDAYKDAYNSRLQEYYSDPTKTVEELRELIKHIRPDEELSPEEREGTPEQIKFPLMEHQKLGLTWMKKMEESYNKGGILADDMGLGKTIQALSLIVSRPPAPGTRKPTLVVAPVALIEQWKREAEKMIKPQHALKVFIVHGPQRQTSWNVLKHQDIILTTYGQLGSELKRKLAWDERLKTYPGARPEAKDYCPILGDQSVSRLISTASREDTGLLAGWYLNSTFFDVYSCFTTPC
jgi:SNF2-related domain